MTAIVAATQVTPTVEVVEVRTSDHLGQSSTQFEVRCSQCPVVSIYMLRRHAETNAHGHECLALQLHRPRCCDDCKPEAMVGLGRLDNAFTTVVCTNCWTDLVTLDPPASGNTVPYVGAYRQQAQS